MEEFIDNYYYTKKEVADIFGVCPATINRWVKRGILHPDKFGNSKQSPVLYKTQEVNEILKNGVK